MQKIKVLSAAGIMFLLIACNTPTPKEQIPETTKNYKINYLPSDWKTEEGIDNVYYSPEMYNAREGGPYSLGIGINSNFSSIDSYLESKKTCVKDLAEFTLNNHPSINYTDICGYQNPKRTVMQIDNTLVEASSYSFSDETKEINSILESLELE